MVFSWHLTFGANLLEQERLDQHVDSLGSLHLTSHFWGWAHAKDIAGVECQQWSLDVSSIFLVNCSAAHFGHVFNLITLH